jgi:hypothetical protein
LRLISLEFAIVKNPEKLEATVEESVNGLQKLGGVSGTVNADAKRSGHLAEAEKRRMVACMPSQTVHVKVFVK